MTTPKPARRRAPNKRQTSDAALAERDDVIWQLKLNGLSLRAIGARVGLSHVSVRDILERGYTERIYPKVDEMRIVELDRLDDLWLKLRPGINDGDTMAINVAIKISDRRAKLLGLDAAQKIETTINTAEDDASRQLAADAARRLAGE